MTRTPESTRPDAIRKALDALRARIKELENAPASSSSGGTLTSPIDLTDIDASAVTDGYVITAASGVWTAAAPTGGTTVINGSVNVTMTGDSGTATYTNAAIGTSSVLAPSIASIVKSDHDGEDHIAEELQVYLANQIVGQVDVTILSPNGGSFGDYQVNIIGV